MERLKLWLDRLLMADLFLVLLSFGWFAIALVGRAAEVPLGFDLWYSLWQPLWQPILGVLFLGAIANGIAGQLSKRFGSQQSK